MNQIGKVTTSIHRVYILNLLAVLR